jgi:hypothetical protein
VSTYPLRVVEESAVKTELGFSSAFEVPGRLSTPALIRATVHELHFILVIDSVLSFRCSLRYTLGPTGPATDRSGAAQELCQQFGNVGKVLQPKRLSTFAARPDEESSGFYCPACSKLHSAVALDT